MTANLIIAVGCTVAAGLIGWVGNLVPAVVGVAGILQAMAVKGILLNLLLAAFNLLPVPPLDGSHVLKYLLPPAWALRYQQIGFAGIVIVLLLLNTRFLSFWLAPSGVAFGLLWHSVDNSILPTTRQWLPSTIL